MIDFRYGPLQDDDVYALLCALNSTAKREVGAQKEHLEKLESCLRVAYSIYLKNRSEEVLDATGPWRRWWNGKEDHDG